MKLKGRPNRNFIKILEGNNMKKIELELTDQEAQYLSIEMNCILRQYQQNYAGRRFDNEDMGNAFNKVFKALTGEDHEQWLRVEKYKLIKEISIQNAKDNGYLIPVEMK
jgi:hypothetical protein